MSISLEEHLLAHCVYTKTKFMLTFGTKKTGSSSGNNNVTRRLCICSTSPDLRASLRSIGVYLCLCCSLYSRLALQRRARIYLGYRLHTRKLQMSYKSFVISVHPISKSLVPTIGPQGSAAGSLLQISEQQVQGSPLEQMF